MPDTPQDDPNLPSPADQPGAVISPGSSETPPPAMPDPAPPAAPDLAPPTESDPSPPPPVPDPAPSPVTPAGPPQPAQPAFEQPGPATADLPPDSVSWTAQEFIAHDKSLGWYTGLAAGAVILAALVYLISKDAISVIVIIVVAIIFGVYGRHKPRELPYRLAAAITIGNKTYSYEAFKSFSIKPEGGLLSLTFMPLKRFAPPLTIYYSPQEEEKIMKILTARIPYEEPRHDAVDSLMRRIRF